MLALILIVEIFSVNGNLASVLDFAAPLGFAVIKY